MDEQHFDIMNEFLLSKNHADVIRQLQPDQINQLFTKLRHHHEHLSQLARQDALTKLPNRFYFELSIKRLLAQAQRHQHKLAVLCLDLDKFKSINDQYGHAAGDLVLVKFAEVLSSVTREEDLAARLGGDEFVVVLPHLAHYQDAGQVATKIMEAVKQIQLPDYPDIEVRCSIGIAGYPIAADGCDTLLQAADKALYTAKERPGCAFEYFTDKAKQAFNHTQKLINTMASQLEKNDLALSYWPIFSLPELQVAGVEVTLPGVHEIVSHLESSDFYEQLSVSYLKHIYEAYLQWDADEVDVTSLPLFIEVNELILNSALFKKELVRLYDSDPGFRKVTILRIVGVNGSLISENIYQQYYDMGATFCFTYNDNQQTNVVRFRDVEAHYIDICLNAALSKNLSIQRNLEFLNGLILFSQTIGAKVILSDIDNEAQRQIAKSSLANYASGKVLQKKLDRRDIRSYLIKNCCHQSS